MKAQIINCKRSDYWYKSMVGKIFEVDEDHNGNSINTVFVKRSPVKKYGNNWPVFSFDVKFIED